MNRGGTTLLERAAGERQPPAAPDRRPRLRDRLADPLFNAVSVLILCAAIAAVLYPLYFVVIASVSEPSRVYEGAVWLWPSGITLDGYTRILTDVAVWRGLANSVLYTSVATTVSVTLILAAGYALSRRDLPGRRLITALIVLTLFFDGGIIPRYLVVQELGLLNTMWAVVLPGAVAVWNLIIARTFFATTVPDELRDAAQLDGANDLRFFWSVVLPLSKPLLALMVMIHLVWNWNAFFDALIYLTDESRYPLQLVLRNILIESEISSTGNLTGDVESYAAAQRVAELAKYSMIVFSTLPLLLLFPFLQKQFTKGALLGAVKS